jgi:hypothetical protein
MANVIIVLAVALGVIMVVDMVVLPAIEAYAKGCAIGGGPFNASKGHCFHPG